MGRSLRCKIVILDFAIFVKKKAGIFLNLGFKNEKSYAPIFLIQRRFVATKLSKIFKLEGGLNKKKDLLGSYGRRSWSSRFASYIQNII